MAATNGTVAGQYFGSSLQAAFAQLTGGGVGPQNLDILQIANPGDNTEDSPNVAVNVDYTGVVHNPASSPTKGTRLGVFSTFLTSGTTAQYFASAFSNLSSLDIFQVINLGGTVSYWLDSAGVAHGS